MRALTLTYNVVSLLGLALLLPLWVLASVFSPRLRNELALRFRPLWQRPTAAPGGLWVHAASVGEVVTVAPLIRRLASAGMETGLLTTTTLRGLATAERASGAAVAKAVLPGDLWPLVRGLFRAARPRALLLVHSEFWPNLLHQAHRRDVPVYVINAKLSDSSFRWFHRFRPLVGPFFEVPKAYLVRSEEDRERFHSLGVPEDRLFVTGSLRFAAAIERVELKEGDALRLPWEGDPPAVIAGSTHEGEEEILLRAFTKLRESFPRVKLVIVPRELERSPAIAAAASRLGLRADRRSAVGEREAEACDVLVWDRFGELARLYPSARVAFVGGSLVDLGGHNPLESGLWGVPTLFGPSRYNVREECEFLERCGLAYVVRGAEEIESVASRCLASSNGRPPLEPSRILEMARRQAVSLERTVHLLEERLLRPPAA